MGFLNNIQEKVGKTEIVSRFDRELEKTEQKIEEQYAALGKAFFTHCGENCPKEYAAYFQKIQNLCREREGIEKRKLASKGLRKCSVCGQVIPLDSAFCNKCGEKLPPLNEDADLSSCCPACGEKLEPGAAFCVRCGAKVPTAE